MTFDVFTRLIDEFAGLEELHLQGLGEPMMHPQFFKMVEYAVDRGIKVSTNTNLTYLTAARAEQCITSGLGELHASLDAATAETYERIRLRARFKAVLDNLRGLVVARRRLASATPRLRIVTVVMRMNLAELPDVVRWANALEIPSVFVQHLCHDFRESTLAAAYRPMRRFIDEQSLLHESPAKVEAVFAETRAVADRCGVTVRLPAIRPIVHPPDLPGRDRCDWPWRGAYVSYQGLAMPCCMVATPDRINFGNMAHSGVEAIWNSQQFHEFRDRLSSDKPSEICQSCSVYNRTF
jgi:radical SAM protein with 4Fe4S-binding SPASM domain